MKRVLVFNCNTNKDAYADVLEESDRRIKVVLQGTDSTITLTRKDTRFPYIGNAFGMEFETFGEEE